MPQPDDPGVPELTPERLRVLTTMADDYIAGRRILCLAARLFVALGTLAGAAAGMVMLMRAIHGGRIELPGSDGGL
jgi:hypothetical protein